MKALFHYATVFAVTVILLGASYTGGYYFLNGEMPTAELKKMAANAKASAEQPQQMAKAAAPAAKAPATKIAAAPKAEPKPIPAAAPKEQEAMAESQANMRTIVQKIGKTTSEQAAPQVAQASAPTPAAPVEVAAIEEIEKAAADPAAGKKIFNKCKACHTADQGGPNRIGPNLWGVVDREIATKADFKYSAAFQEKAGMVWTEEHLNEYLTNPKAYIPGNKMVFAGLKKEADRANLIAWLKTLK